MGSLAWSLLSCTSCVLRPESRRGTGVVSHDQWASGMELLDNGVFDRDLASSSIYSPLLPRLSYKSPSLKEVYFPELVLTRGFAIMGGRPTAVSYKCFEAKVHQ